MTFDLLFHSIESASIRAVAAHWNAARGSNRLPSWAQLRPSQMAQQLSIVWAYRYYPKTGEFIGRLAGDRITRGFGRGFQGIRLADIHPPETLPRVHEVMMRVVQTPAIYRSHGKLFRKDGRIGTGERIILPLGPDGDGADGVIGASDFPYLQGSDAPAPVELLSEAEEWFDIGA